MSSASTSGVNFANAFFDPSGLHTSQSPIHPPHEFLPTYLIRVLILTQSTSYNFFNASLICLLFALTSTINTSVLFSSIFFIALSVFNGWITTLLASRRGT